MCNTCGCKKAESFDAEMPNIVIPHGVDITSKIEKLSQRLGKHRIMSQDLRDKQFEAETWGVQIYDTDLTMADVKKMLKDAGIKTKGSVRKIGNGYGYYFKFDSSHQSKFENAFNKFGKAGNYEYEAEDFGAETFEADFDNAPYDSFDEAMSDNVSIPEKEYEIDDRDIYNPDRAAMDMIRGNRALREEMEEQGVYVGRHPGYYNDNGQWG